MLTKEYTSLHSLSIFSCFVAILPKCNWSINIILLYYQYQKYLDGQKKQVSPEKNIFLEVLLCFNTTFQNRKGFDLCRMTLRTSALLPGSRCLRCQLTAWLFSKRGWGWFMMMMVMVMSIFIGLYVFCGKQMAERGVFSIWSRKAKVTTCEDRVNCPSVGLRMNLIPTTLFLNPQKRDVDLGEIVWREIICPVDLKRRKMIHILPPYKGWFLLDDDKPLPTKRWCFIGQHVDQVVVSNICFFFTFTWGKDPIWLIFFRWVETTT